MKALHSSLWAPALSRSAPDAVDVPRHSAHQPALRETEWSRVTLFLETICPNPCAPRVAGSPKPGPRRRRSPQRERFWMVTEAKLAESGPVREWQPSPATATRRQRIAVRREDGSVELSSPKWVGFPLPRWSSWFSDNFSSHRPHHLYPVDWRAIHSRCPSSSFLKTVHHIGHRADRLILPSSLNPFAE